MHTFPIRTTTRRRTFEECLIVRITREGCRWQRLHRGLAPGQAFVRSTSLGLRYYRLLCESRICSDFFRGASPRCGIASPRCPFRAPLCEFLINYYSRCHADGYIYINNMVKKYVLNIFKNSALFSHSFHQLPRAVRSPSTVRTEECPPSSVFRGERTLSTSFSRQSIASGHRSS